MRRFVVVACGLLVITLLLPSAGGAQPRGSRAKVEITPFGGFQWNSRTNTYGGYISTKDGVNFGGTIDVALNSDVELEFLYIQFPSEATIVIENTGYTSFSTGYLDVSTHYFQIGYIRPVNRGGKVEPFVAGSIGAVLFTGSEFRLPDGTRVDPEDAWRFGFTLGGGARIYFGERIGLRVQARIMAPLYFSGAGVYFGTGGSGVGVSGGLPILQGDFTAGLIIRL